MNRPFTREAANLVLKKYENATVEEIKQKKMFIFNDDFHDPEFISRVNKSRDLAERYDNVFKKLQEAARI